MTFADCNVTYHRNFNLNDIVTPVNVKVLTELLLQSSYDSAASNFLIQGFTYGFDIGYRGPLIRKDRSANLPFHVGNKLDLWNKVMKEVGLGRYAGPFEKEDIPYQNYIQSPIGLVPKAGNQTRLIFHLSYDFKEGKSVNYHTPKELSSVKYRDLDYAIKTCLKWGAHLTGGQRLIFCSHSDIRSAFRILPTSRGSWPWLLLKAQDPRTGVWYYFFDKSVPFGARISCALFQKFSDCLQHVVEFLTGKKMSVTNYLDDFLFVSATEQQCNYLVRTFIEMCSRLGVPTADDKTEWASTRTIFLGILILGDKFMLSIPDEKRVKALNMAKLFISKKRATVHELQRYTGYLNFLCKAIFPGRVFTRRMYAKFSFLNHKSYSGPLKSYHHVNLDCEFKNDCRTWVLFLDELSVNTVCRPFVDLTKVVSAEKLNFYTDSSAAESLGFGGIFNQSWFYGKWEPGYIRKYRPSIEYLELYAVVMGIFIWTEKLQNSRIVVFCDNQTVVRNLNTTTSGCKNVMYLLRLLVLNGLRHNIRVFGEWVEGAENTLSDHLSRQRIRKFKQLSPRADKFPQELSTALWPASKLWQK